MANEIITTTGGQIQTVEAVNALIADWHTALDLLVRAGELSATTATTYKIGMGRFVTWLVDHGQATPDAIREWKSAMLANHAPGSVNTWMSGVRAFFGWAVESGRMATNPAVNIRGAKRTGTAKRHKRDVLTDTEVVRLLDLELSPRDRALINLFIYTGARQIELHRADLAHLRTEGNALVLDVQGKGRAEADEIIVIAHPEVQQALYGWLAVRGNEPGPLFTSDSDRTRGGRLSLRAIREIVKGAYRQVGIVGERKTTHSLRHTAITNVLRNGGTLQQAQGVARHANMATTSIYAHELNRVENAGEKLIDYRKPTNS